MLNGPPLADGDFNRAQVARTQLVGGRVRELCAEAHPALPLDALPLLHEGGPRDSLYAGLHRDLEQEAHDPNLCPAINTSSSASRQSTISFFYLFSRSLLFLRLILRLVQLLRQSAGLRLRRAHALVEVALDVGSAAQVSGSEQRFQGATGPLLGIGWSMGRVERRAGSRGGQGPRGTATRASPSSSGVRGHFERSVVWRSVLDEQSIDRVRLRPLGSRLQRKV